MFCVLDRREREARELQAQREVEAREQRQQKFQVQFASWRRAIELLLRSHHTAAHADILKIISCNKLVLLCFQTICCSYSCVQCWACCWLEENENSFPLFWRFGYTSPACLVFFFVPRLFGRRMIWTAARGHSDSCRSVSIASVAAAGRSILPCCRACLWRMPGLRT